MKTLRMKFATTEGTTFTYSLNYAKETLTSGAVEDAMEALITNGFFAEGFAGLSGADLVDRTVTPLF